jgi:hypothetical protein
MHWAKDKCWLCEARERENEEKKKNNWFKNSPQGSMKEWINSIMSYFKTKHIID